MGWNPISSIGSIFSGFGSFFKSILSIFSYSPKLPKPTPATVDAFGITTAEEGGVVPLIFGTVRLPGNILWHGNFRTETKHARGEGRPIEGYWYILSMWQEIGQGLLEIIDVYIQDKKASWKNYYTYTPGSGSGGISRQLKDSWSGTNQDIIYNPGDRDYYPSAPGELSAIMNPVCHVFCDRWWSNRCRYWF